ncbi:hypothetical protein [Mycobacterium sp. 852002-10029_SCH5224772]|uniref:hypothetical protein n=1 Tax=Mycobacterium sp. 852002-10029_SCH5224772 TaxID=1834083 RepID=UPI0008006580|nr:hypothetical protein [Mycobacterium sp. 852002-10029_SCH5224772]OBF10741.1 hypothetical protein A5775_17510 [Mycobacterium sp. 852002-10029_SCH5224772]
MIGYIAGVIGGIVGGLAIAALGMAYGAASGRGLWGLPNSIGGIILGPGRANTRSFGVATLVGAALHIVLSAVFGIVIVFVAQNFTHAYLATGLVAGAALWLINYVGIGAIHPGAREVAKLNPVPIAFGLHLLFGLIASGVAFLIQSGS